MSKLQELARKRNSYKGRIKGLRNNIRGMEETMALTLEEENELKMCETKLDDLLENWDDRYEEIKESL